MASIIRTSLSMGWDGDEAIAGLAKVADNAKKTGQHIDDLAVKEKRAAAEQAAFNKKLEGMNALEQKQAILARQTKQRRMWMTAEAIQAEIAAEKKGEEVKAAQAKKAADKAAALEEWRKKSLFQKAAHLTSGAADIRAAGGMALGAASGIASGAVQFAQMGAELESMQIRAAYMAGSFAKGTKAIEDMRQASMASGIALKENVAAMSQMANAGISMETATRTVQQASAAAELLGENGMASISGSISALYKAGTASSGELDALQSQGLHVYEELAKVLENTTGKTHSLEEAMGAVRQGAVSSSEAVRAVMAASNNKEMQDAAARFAGSFEGQIKRLKTTMDDTFREISKMFLDTFDITSIAAGLRGAFMAIRDIVKEIANTFLPVIDPKDKAQGIENTFKAMRDIVYDLAEKIAKAVIDLRQAFETLLPIIEANINKFMKRMEYGLSGIFAGDEINRFYESEDAVARMKGRGAATRADAARSGVDKFFGGVRANAAARDAANIAKPAERIAEANRKLENGAGDAALALETMAKSSRMFATNTLAEMRTPFEQFSFEVNNLSKRWSEADAALAAGQLKENELAAFRNAATRKGGKLLQDLIANNIGGESQFSSGALRGSAAEVEMRVRAQYGEETMSIQEKIRIATERAAFNSDKQLAYSAQLVEAYSRQKGPPVAQIGGK